MKSYRADFCAFIFFIFLGAVAGGALIADKKTENQNRTEYLFKNSATQSKNFSVFGESYLLPIERALTPEKKEGWKSFEIQARSALAIDDLSGKIMYEKSAGEKVAIASITKLATAAVILNLADDSSPAGASGEKYNLDREITIDKSAVETEGDSGALVVGEKIKARDLLNIMLIVSSNDAAIALAEDVVSFAGRGKDATYFTELMNGFARKNSLSDTRFANPAGIDDKDNYSTARDVVKLSAILLKERPEIFEITITPETDVKSIDGEHSHFIKNTNKLIGRLPGIVGGKTGYTDEAGESLLLIVKNPTNNHKIIVVVIGAKNRFVEMEKLMNWIWDSYEWK